MWNFLYLLFELGICRAKEVCFFVCFFFPPMGVPLIFFLIGSGFSASWFYFYFSYSVSLGETIIYYDLGRLFFYVRVSLFSLHSFNIFGVTAVFSMDTCCLFFSVCSGSSSIESGCDWCCADKSLHWRLSKASSMLCGCHSPIRGRTTIPLLE